MTSEPPSHPEDFGEADAYALEDLEPVEGEVVQPPGPGQQQGQTVVTAAAHAGPLPRPGTLRGYDLVVPGAAARIVTLMEDEAGHRRWVDRRYVQYRHRSLAAAFVLAMTVALGGIVLIALGKSTAGLVALITELAVLLGAFGLSQKFRRNGATS